MVFSNPVTNPEHVRTLCWGKATSLSLTIGSDGTEYVGLEGYKNEPAKVLVFAPGADGCKPERVITTNPPMEDLSALVEASPYLYALALYDAHSYIVVLDPTQGAQTPIARVYLPYEAYGLTIGP